jgi:hypothetical protein
MEATLMRTIGKAMLIGALALAFTAPVADFSASAQSGGENRGPVPIAVGDRVYCAGFVSEAPVNADLRLVSPVNYSRTLFVNGDRAYINKGKADGIQVGDVYQIVRPLGAFYHPFKKKESYASFSRKGDRLGYYTEEIGFVRVIAVYDARATIEVTETCSEAKLGDALVRYEKPVLPEQRAYTPLDPLSAPNGKTTGRIVLARNSREQLVTSDVVTLDVGQKAGIKVGDYFTIYREHNSDAINKYNEDEISPKNTEGGSDRFRGNDRSIIYPAEGGKREKLLRQYPNNTFPRTVVGELVVTRVEGNTANAIITRTQNGEAFLGDFVELQ